MTIDETDVDTADPTVEDPMADPMSEADSAEEAESDLQLYKGCIR